MPLLQPNGAAPALPALRTCCRNVVVRALLQMLMGPDGRPQDSCSTLRALGDSSLELGCFLGVRSKRCLLLPAVVLICDCGGCSYPAGAGLSFAGFSSTGLTGASSGVHRLDLESFRLPLSSAPERVAPKPGPVLPIYRFTAAAPVSIQSRAYTLPFDPAYSARAGLCEQLARCKPGHPWILQAPGHTFCRTGRDQQRQSITCNLYIRFEQALGRATGESFPVCLSSLVLVRTGRLLIVAWQLAGVD